MRCRDAKVWLAAQRNGDLAQSDTEDTSIDPALLSEHIQQCVVCRAYEQSQGRVETLLRKTPSTLHVYSSISTERIMLAVQQQKWISQQLEDIRVQQQTRLAPLRQVGPSLAALIFFTLGSIPLLLLALAILQPDLMLHTFAALSNGIDVLIVLAQYVQTGLMLVTRDTWLLSGVAFVLVVMMGVWLRLMRHPQEA